MNRNVKYILAALFIALPFPFMLLFSKPKLGGAALLVLAVPMAVLMIYRKSDAKSALKPPTEKD